MSGLVTRRSVLRAALLGPAVGLGGFVLSPRIADAATPLQTQLDALRPGQTFTLQRTTYSHDVPLVLRVPNVLIRGNGATILATNEARSAIQIIADGVQLENVNVNVQSTTRRWDAPDQHKIVINGADNVTLKHIWVMGSAAAGVFVMGRSSKFWLERVTVSNTRADGIHLTDGANNGTVTLCTASRTGDDGVAVVSYGDEPSICQNISILSPVVQNQTWGRGVSVVGGSGIKVDSPTVTNSACASIYVACEGDPYNTMNAGSVSVTNAVITGANQNSSVDHGAVLVNSSRAGGSVASVTMSGFSISKTRSTVSREVGIVSYNGGAVSGIRMTNFTLAQKLAYPFGTNVNKSSYTLSGWTVAGAAYSG
ncbi:MAG: right-handed parallel beta-helix repeat-containing protein [Nocardiaceae bacterium]|nr:right-handed parallel beta-helix repeat-containing protein [Nocardiaceae bacterium]